MCSLLQCCYAIKIRHCVQEHNLKVECYNTRYVDLQMLGECAMDMAMC